MTVNEIREELIKKYEYSEEQVCAIKGVTELRLELESAKRRSEKIEQAGIFATAITEPNKLIKEVVEEEVEKQSNIPSLGTVEWEEYVLSKLKPNELDEKNGKKYPKASGLRRVAQLLLGPIVESGPVSVVSPVEIDKPGRATVIYEIKIKWFADAIAGGWFDPAIHAIEYRTFREAADAWRGNTPDTFAIHPVATASSRAEGRALRRALQLNTLVAEEMESNPNFVPEPVEESSGILDHQTRVILQLCGRLKINVNKLVEHHYNNKFDLTVLTKDEAASLIKILNQYQNKGPDSQEIPATIKD